MLTLAPVTINSTMPVDVPLPTTAAAIIIDNLTGYTLQAQMSGTGSAIWVQASQGNILKAPSTLGFTGTLVLTPYALQTNQSQAPGSQVTITIYGAGEQLPTNYPTTLGGLTNIGNPSFTIQSGTVTVNGTVSVNEATAINQTGEAPGNGVVYALPAGDSNAAQGTINLNNLGQMTLGDPAYNGSLLIQGTNSAQISLSLTGFLRMLDSLGNLDIDLEPGSTTINGSTSGTAQLWQFLKGNIKAFLIVCNNFRNGGASNQFITLPVALNFGGAALVSTFPLASFMLANVAKATNVLTTLSGTGAGTVSTTTNIFGNAILLPTSGIDQIRFNSGQASASSGVMFLIGS